MIGIDTNVLLRLLLDDDPSQNAKVDALMAAHARAPGSVLISDVVLAETVWTLRTVYEQPKSTLISAVNSLLAQAAFAFEHRSAVERAVTDFRGSNAGFSDCLIAAKHAALGCALSATFDRKMRALAGVKLL